MSWRHFLLDVSLYLLGSFNILQFRRARKLPCTSQTAKSLAKMTHWKPNTELSLEGINQLFDIDDFCTLIQKGCFKSAEITLFHDASLLYRAYFEMAIENLKKLL